MTEKNWVSIPFHRQWIEKILDLRLQVFNDHKYTQKRYEWQYLNNPQGHAHLALAVDKETNQVLAGHYATMPHKVKYGNEVINFSQSVDTFTNSAFRNQGIFIDLANITYDLAIKDNVSGILGFPNSNSLPGFIRKLGFSDPFGLQFWVKTVSFGVIFKKLKLPAVIGNFFGKIPLILPPGHTIKNFHEVTSLPNDWDYLQAEFEKIFPICILRSKDYMNWRFFNCPDRSYKFFEYRDNGVLIGFVVLAITNDKYPTGQIVDLLISNIAYCPELIKLATWKLKTLGAHTVITYLHKENIIAQHFSKLSFRPRGSEVRFILKDLGKLTDFDNFGKKASNWYLTGGDTDYL